MAISTLLPSGTVIGIGSLPFTDPQAAVDFVAQQSPQVPFWPQLPQRTPAEMMIPQFLKPICHLLQPRGDQYGYTVKPSQVKNLIACLRDVPVDLDPESATGFFAFIEAAQTGRFAEALAVKGQITGPITLAFQLFSDNHPLVQSTEFIRTLTAYVIRQGQWQIQHLSQAHKPILLFVDEPCLALLDQLGDPVIQETLLAALSDVLRALREFGAVVGLHCCSSASVEWMTTAQPDLLSFDAYEHLEGFCAHPAMARFVARGGVVVCGLIPTLNDLAAVNIHDLFLRWVLAVKRCAEPEKMIQQTLISATCGLGLVSQEAAGMSFKMAQQLGSLIDAAQNTLTPHRFFDSQTT